MPTGVSRALPSTGPPAGGMGSYPRGARGLRLRGFLHLPITYCTPAAGWRTPRALESGWNIKLLMRLLVLHWGQLRQSMIEGWMGLPQAS